MHKLSTQNSSEIAGHAIGLASIIQLVGPDAFQDGHHHQAFVFSRLVLRRRLSKSSPPSWMYHCEQTSVYNSRDVLNKENTSA
ncbi:hypothetical protein LMH87_000878 [Akanthomyces muscarius]|uniref:Uncharacterized protein n=1 Tax=Akanthomyces muscarius TaxID=2231603 RepID=A0A9W8QHQ5_AKAMU|nr:hypothetical protein LMH87_000878 [Akanthomyces muscarius]KAJ4155642.1 hypothetical protein LMH87_000878 [Akanthomyces muscarius]